jgi:hypothetical protein
MRTALDAPPSILDEQETNFVSLIRKHGWMHTSVSADEEGPGFSYTTGLWLRFNFPELILFSLNKVAHDTLWHVYRELENGQRFPIGEPIDSIFENVQAVLLPVPESQFASYLGWSRWFYGGNGFQCVQLVWPDRHGLFPWQIGCVPEVVADQTDLTNWITLRRH